MVTNSAKANHYVSQCYLQGFAEPTSDKEKLWSYGCYKDSTDVSVHLVRIEATAFTNNLYGVTPEERARMEADFGVAEAKSAVGYARTKQVLKADGKQDGQADAVSISP
jgi:hypothetical protein